jgi:hypothetical protein
LVGWDIWGGKKGGKGELFSGVVDGIFSGVVCSWTVEYWSILVQIVVVVSVPDCDVWCVHVKGRGEEANREAGTLTVGEDKPVE